MKLIVGLGNPGAQYDRTRHNVGYMVVDRLAARHAPGAVARSKFHAWTVEARLSDDAGGDAPCLLMKPTTYMNRSGQSVAEAVRFYKVDPSCELLVIVDDVYLSAGMLRLRGEGGAGGHNGLADVQRVLATPAYSRLRIGIDDPGQIPQSSYVLGRFTEEQWAQVDTAIARAVDAAEVWATAGIDSAMNRFNVRQKSTERTSQSQETTPESLDEQHNKQ